MKKILVVEDDPMLLEIYQKKFNGGEFEVITATSGIEAEKKAAAEKPDLILLDLVLPEKDGLSVLKTIKEDNSLQGTKVVIFSNLSQEEEQQKAQSLGADGFIVKSEFTPQQLVDKVKEILAD
jgi:two-component system alkaline phosphatase synthesis response regulator PhoP